MGKEPVQQKPKKDPPSKTGSGGNGSALVVIIAIISVIGIGLYLFKDKIFKKNLNNLSDMKPKEGSPKEETTTEPEVLEGKEKEEISDKFAKLD